MSRRKRPTSEYLEAAKRLAMFAPGLKKYRRRKKLSPSEKGAIARKERVLRYTDHLIPVTKKMARELKGQLFAPGVQAIQLRNTSPHAKIRRVKKDIIVTSNGRTFLYWRLLDLKPKSLKKAAKEAFENIRGAFPVEQIAELAQRAFKSIKTKQVFLWAESGRVGEGFRNFDEFVQWLYESYSSYRNVERWVNGIAIQI